MDDCNRYSDNQDLKSCIDYGVIPNDEIKLQIFARKVRRGQTKFRNALVRSYDGACCISGCKVDFVLEACHIEPHFLKGNNDLSNGLLLRSDLHVLFDQGYLFIEPGSHRIHLHPELKQSDYWQFNGHSLKSRIDKSSVGDSYLASIWIRKKW